MRTSPEFTAASLPNIVAVVMGAGFLGVGLAGFISPDRFHAHLNWAHNLIHIVTGAAALGAGLLGNLGCARSFNLTFGLLYGGLGLLGFVLGSPGVATVGDLAHDERLWGLIPEILEWGTVDHSIHLLTGLLFVIGGLVGFSEAAERSRRISGS
jgi:hypothetical protein